MQLPHQIIIQLEELESPMLCLSAGKIYSTIQGIWADNSYKTSTFFFSLPQEVANNVPRLKEKDQAPSFSFILVALVTILQQSTSSWHDENVRMRIGRSNGSGWVHLYWHRPFKEVQVCIVGRGDMGKRSPPPPKKICAHWPKVPPNICAHCPLSPPKPSCQIHVVPNIYLHTKNS